MIKRFIRGVEEHQMQVFGSYIRDPRMKELRFTWSGEYSIYDKKTDKFVKLIQFSDVDHDPQCEKYLLLLSSNSVLAEELFTITDKEIIDSFFECLEHAKKNCSKPTPPESRWNPESHGAFGREPWDINDFDTMKMEHQSQLDQSK